MMGWAVILFLAVAVGGGLWRFGRFDKATGQLLAAALLIAMAGYAWQGHPALPGSPTAARQQASIQTGFAETRGDLIGRFTSADQFLIMAESYQRRGNSKAGVDILRNGLKRNPEDAVLWIGLGNALVIHGEGVITPAARLAFDRAAARAPDHPAPPFFYALSLAQAGQIDEAETLWRSLRETVAEDSAWRTAIEERLQLIRQARQHSRQRQATPAQGQGRP
jgi:cytochrome c-type biogenesis protein CcmH